MAFYNQEIGGVFSKLKTSEKGLSSKEAVKRLEKYGLNELKAEKKTTPLQILLEQFKDALIIILLVAIVISAYVGYIEAGHISVEAIAIAVIVLFAVALGFIQEYRAEQAIEKLKEMAAPNAHVLRDGHEHVIPAHDLVPGDVVILRAGDFVPADLRLMEAVNLRVEEASLTGESQPVSKIAELIDKTDLAVGDRKNMAYSGTAVTYGRGTGVVVGTGMETEFGKVAQLLQSVERVKTPLQLNLDKVGHQLAIAAGVVVAVIFGLGLYRGQPALEMFIFAIALAVAVVPEALPAVVTVSLSIGTTRMVKRNALVRKLPAVETLGSTTIICSDKTGTLTKDQMTIRRLHLGSSSVEVTGAGYAPEGDFLSNGSPLGKMLEEDVHFLLRGASLNCDAILHKDENGMWDIKGDPTEGAFVTAAQKAGWKKSELDVASPRVDEIPFTSETKRMTTLHKTKSGKVAYSKGAPEVILKSCTKFREGGKDKQLTDAMRKEFLARAEEMASDALRVLGVAYKPRTDLAQSEKEMTFLGLAGMIDPPRPESKEAIALCKEAGIRVIMITGDHPVTAQAVASELNLLDGGKVVTGAELDAMSDKKFNKEVEEIQVYARVSPQHKLKVVAALQAKGEVVAMTGDGVNDAPALKKADIGIAMGITGTEVSKEAAVVNLTDDNFASIVAAVEEGRGIYGNIKKYLMYLLSSNIGEILLMAVAALFFIDEAGHMILPLTAAQILYVNLATDGLPALALSVDPPEDDLMERPPRRKSEGIFTRPILALMIAGGVWSAIVNVGVFQWSMRHGSLEYAMTHTFISLVLIQFFKAYNFRSDRHSVLRHTFANKWLNRAVLWEWGLLFVIVYVPFLQKMFTTVSMPLIDWVYLTLLALTVVPVLEFTKWLVNRGVFGKLSA